MKILLACPIHETKTYALERWLNGVRALSYPDLEFLLVDTSPTLEFFEQWKARAWNQGIPMVHLDLVGENTSRRIALGMEVVRKHFLSGDCAKWLDLESDVIAPPDLIERLLEQGEWDWLSQPCPARGGDQMVAWGFACALFSRRIAETVSFADAPRTKSPDGWYLAQTQARADLKLKRSTANVRLEHLNG